MKESSAEKFMALNHSLDTDDSTIPAALRRFLRKRAYELTGVFILACVVALGLALASWTPADPSLNHATGEHPKNWLGYAGAYAADQLMQFLGFGVLAFLVVPLSWAAKFFRHQAPENPKLISLCWIGATCAFSCLLSTFPTPNNWALAGGLGGNIGEVMGGGLLSILTIGIKGFIAQVLVVAVALVATWWTVLRAMNLENFEFPSFGSKPSATSIRIQKSKAPVAKDAVGFSMLASLSKLAENIFARKAPAPKRKIARTTFEDDAAPDDVLSRFAPISLNKKPAKRVEPTLLDAHEDNSELDEQDFAEQDVEDNSAEDYGDEEEADEILVPVAKSTHRAKSKSARPSFELPSLELLSEPKKIGRQPEFSPEFLAENARRLEGVLEDFGVRGQIINVRPGPVVTLYELEPAPGIKSSRVISLADDIARSMSAISARVAVVSGRNAIGIELPNPKRETVYLRELFQGENFIKNNTNLTLALGKNIGGEPIFADLAKMPHLLIAGTTGSGKSVGINTMILSLLYRLPPDKCKLIMIDPKMLELSVYEGIPHLLAPVVTDPRKAVVALKWAVREMEDRYKKMSKTGVRNVDGYNTKLAAMVAKGDKLTRTVQTGFDPDTGKPIFEQEDMDMQPMPYIVVIIDEMADLMMVAGKDIEGAVQRLAQMARAAGIHVVMATQRPSVDVITGTIKANFPTRISFQVTSKIDSRTILGEQGAEQLLGQGDMLYMAGGGRISRLHAPFVTDGEVEEIVNHLKAQGAPEYVEAVTEEIDEDDVEGGLTIPGGEGGSGDELYDQAVAVVLRDKKVSTSYVQRRLQVGYNKAASLIERMEKEGLISSANATGKREILVPGDSARL
jgi:DNA segregation ATPase FtsK/SpoIIIE, S-DNA-T family